VSDPDGAGASSFFLLPHAAINVRRSESLYIRARLPKVVRGHALSAQNFNN
jgi:hypothetical protein